MAKMFQKLGKSLMLPLAVLPVCGVLMGIGYLMCPAYVQGGEVSGVIPAIGCILATGGSAIINNISWLFVIGVAVGMSDDGDGTAALCGLVSWLIMITMLSADNIGKIFPSLLENETYRLAFEKIQNPFVAMLSGIIGAYCYNNYRTVELPDFLGFFSRKRFAIIASACISIVVEAILSIVWPLAFRGLTITGKAILSAGGIGVGIYAFLNRLLIPTGLHHALNNIFWFDTIGIGDLTAYWAGKTSADVGWSLGMYMSGFFPCVMFGVAGAALALYQSVDNKKALGGILIPSVLCAFISGITEPFEFSFMFICFPLYVVYSALYGILAIITYYSGFRAGFSFSSGAIDLFFSSYLPAAQKTWMILPLGALSFVLFYFTFKVFIKKFNVKYAIDMPDTLPAAPASQMKQSKGESKAGDMIRALGGASNINSVACCATRLRLDMEDTSLIDEKAVKEAGGVACIIIDKKTCQVIVGLKVQKICDEMNSILMSNTQRDSHVDTGEHTMSKVDMQVISITKTGQGIAMGPAFCADRKVSLNEGSRIKASADEEWKAFEKAREIAKNKLNNAKGEMKEILAAYALFLDDETAVNDARKAVYEDGKSASEATDIAGKAGKEKLLKVDNEYIRSRADDVIAAFDYLKRELDGEETPVPKEPSVIIGSMLMPTDLSRIGEDNVLALITEKGSQTSHLAIIAKGLGIPYAVCSNPALKQLENGDYIIVDTEEGKIIINPDEETRNRAKNKCEEQNKADEESESVYQSGKELPVKIYANISTPRDLKKVLEVHADGIGLFRSEFLFLDREAAPDEEEQFEAYKSVVEGMEGKPVIIRTSDIGTDKKPSYMNLSDEENPALGKRAIRLSLTDPDTFRVQLRALLRAACFGDERIMYPMITSVNEIKLINEQIKKAAEELNLRKAEYRIPPCGIMIETPAAAVISDALAKEVSFFSIGTNDLTQYTLALDRQGEGMELFSDDRHEAVLRLIEMTAKNAKAAGIETGICGELASDEKLLERFIKAGVDELSMSAALIPKVRKKAYEYAEAAEKTETAEATQPAETTETAPAMKSEDLEIAAPADGILIKMEDIPDEVFASGSLGKCFAVEPDNGNIYAPAGGEIVTIAETLHAVSIKTDNGQNILIHAGIDTVKLNGKAFSTDIKVGDRVEKGQLILKADIDAIRKAGYSAMIITVLLE